MGVIRSPSQNPEHLSLTFPTSGTKLSKQRQDFIKEKVYIPLFGDPYDPFFQSKSKLALRNSVFQILCMRYSRVARSIHIQFMQFQYAYQCVPVLWE